MPLIRAEHIRKFQHFQTQLLHDKSQVLYLPFDKDDGSYARDRSGYNNHGVIYGAQHTAGIIGEALSFDGVDDYVSVPHSASLVSPSVGITVCAWVKRNVLYAFHRIVTKDAWTAGFIFRIEDNNKLMTSMWFTDGTSTPELEYLLIDDLLWHFVAFTFDSSTGKIVQWKDASAYEWTGYAGKTIKWGTGSLKISSASDNQFNGLIDEVRIYNRALTQAEIQRVMNMRGI